MKQRSDNLATHCRSQHNDSTRALKVDEKPVKPIYFNWKGFVEKYPNEPPIRNLAVE